MKRIFFVVLLAFVLLAGCKKDVRVETSDLSQASPACMQAEHSRSLDPVSYTHLDVYKRQLPGFLMIGDRCLTGAPVCAPVSYTHLCAAASSNRLDNHKGCLRRFSLHPHQKGRLPGASSCAPKF